ncbi:ribosomal-protein-alanine acetyltransferase [Clostridia bacterium]|nr:ribosomal-protein-alanine acetyltransferase [Clostridia bacterium]
MTVNIRRAEIGDQEQILDLQRKCFKEPWSETVCQEALQNPIYFNLVACIEQKLVACLICVLITSEAEIQSLAVLEQYRRQGIASLLLERIIQYLHNKDIQDIFLEVRQSNLSAIQLYQHFGFVQQGLRKDYYRKPIESALLMGYQISKKCNKLPV